MIPPLSFFTTSAWHGAFHALPSHLVVVNKRGEVANDVGVVERLEEVNLLDAILARFCIDHVEDL